MKSWLDCITSKWPKLAISIGVEIRMIQLSWGFVLENDTTIGIKILGDEMGVILKIICKNR